MMVVNPFDVAVGLICLGSVFFGYARGLVSNLISYIGTLGGLIAALYFHQQVGAWLGGILPSLKLADLLAYVLLSASGYFLGLMVFSNAEDDTRNTGLWAVCNAGIGLSKGWTISTALYWIMLYHFRSALPNIEQAWVHPYLSYTLRLILNGLT